MPADQWEEMISCSACMGDGSSGGVVCTKCGGRGTVEAVEKSALTAERERREKAERRVAELEEGLRAFLAAHAFDAVEYEDWACEQEAMDNAQAALSPPEEGTDG